MSLGSDWVEDAGCHQKPPGLRASDGHYLLRAPFAFWRRQTMCSKRWTAHGVGNLLACHAGWTAFVTILSYGNMPGDELSLAARVCQVSSSSFTHGYMHNCSVQSTPPLNTSISASDGAKLETLGGSLTWARTPRARGVSLLDGRRRE